MGRVGAFGVCWTVCFVAKAMGEPPIPQPPAPVIDAAAVGQALSLQQQLADKIAQRDQLQREIEDITRALNGGEQVLLKLEVLELNLTQMRRLGFAPAIEPGREMEVEKRGELLRLLAELRKNNFAKALMNPTMATVSGRRTSVFSGEAIPVTTATGVSELREFGTRVEFAPLVQDDGRLQLEVRPIITRRGETSDATASDGHKVPVADIVESITVCNLAFGEAAVIVGPVEQRTMMKRGALGRVTEAFDIATVVIVTPERASAVSPAGYSAPVR